MALSCESASSNQPFPKPWANKCPPEKSNMEMGTSLKITGGLVCWENHRTQWRLTFARHVWLQKNGSQNHITTGESMKKMHWWQILKVLSNQSVVQPLPDQISSLFHLTRLELDHWQTKSTNTANTYFILAKSVWFICKQNAWSSHFKTLVAWWFHPCSAMEFSSSCHLVAATTLSHT